MTHRLTVYGKDSYERDVIKPLSTLLHCLEGHVG